jgi:4,5-dihydroxyphthalate decarboxylase
MADLEWQTLELTAIPIFVTRMFRHSYIYINKSAGIRSPADLNGKRIGVQNWLTTTAVWARGLLADEYGLDPKIGNLGRRPHEWRRRLAAAGMVED